MTFGEKLQKLRKESGLSQEELADQLNVSGNDRLPSGGRRYTQARK